MSSADWSIDYITERNKQLREENEKLRHALKNLLAVVDGEGGTEYPTKEIAYNALNSEKTNETVR